MMVSGIFSECLLIKLRLSQLGALYNRTLPTQECEASYKGDTPLNYNHIKFNVKVGMSSMARTA